MYPYIIVMKVGPHSKMTLAEIIQSKKEEEIVHGVHFWGYSGVFCQPKKVQEFCKKAEAETRMPVKLILLETKSNYDSDIGFIESFSKDGTNYEKFQGPVQLQGAQFSFVGKNIQKITDFSLDSYVVVGGKNDGHTLSSHLQFRINKSFAKWNHHDKCSKIMDAWTVDLVEPYAIWLKE